MEAKKKNNDKYNYPLEYTSNLTACLLKIRKHGLEVLSIGIVNVELYSGLFVSLITAVFSLYGSS